MRDLIVSAIAVSALIAVWLLFSAYSDSRIESFTHTIEAEILPMVEEENWPESNKQISALNESWHRYKKTALLFLDTESINEIDYSLAKSLKYIAACDLSNSSGELLVLHEQFIYLSTNEKISLANIL